MSKELHCCAEVFGSVLVLLEERLFVIFFNTGDVETQPDLPEADEDVHGEEEGEADLKVVDGTVVLLVMKVRRTTNTTSKNDADDSSDWENHFRSNILLLKF